MHFEVERTIARGAAEVWAALTDKTVLVERGFGILKLEGEIAPRGRLKLWSEVSPQRAFPLRVTEFTPPQRMVWESGMPLGLFKGTRVFSLSETRGQTTFKMREDFTGPLAGLIGRSIPDLTPSFEKFADALKRICEGGQ